MQLLLEAKKAAEQAYAPYSQHKVGAALLTKSGRVYHGCNIENAAFSPTVCAERTAFFKAVYDGHREFVKIAIVGGKDAQSAQKPCAPCGVCRQVMMEFCDPESFAIVLADGAGGCMQVLLKDLLPFGFGPANL